MRFARHSFHAALRSGGGALLLSAPLIGCPNQDDSGPGGKESAPDSGAGTDSSGETAGDSSVDTSDSDDSGETGDSGDTAPPDVSDLASAELIGYNSGLPLSRCNPSCMSVSGAGDVDGDGLLDVVVGIPDGSFGMTFLVRGPVLGVNELEFADAIVEGTYEYEYAGYSVAGVGDTNADGFDDILIGAPYFSDDAYFYPQGRACLMGGPLSGSMDFDSCTATLIGEYTGTDSSTMNETGDSVAAAGDANGDGFADILISSRLRSYLLAGPVTGEQALSESTYTTFPGSLTLDGDGDTDGDGLSDVLLGYGNASTVAAIYLSPTTGVYAEEDADATLMDSSEASIGYGPVFCGDVNADGYDDVLADAIRGDTLGQLTGGAYLVSGPVVGSVELTAATATIEGVTERAQAGQGLAGGGDHNGDGNDDLAVAGPEANDNGEGTTYILFGPVTGTIPLSDADVAIRGRGHDQLGRALAGVGDLDGDGLDDLLISAVGDEDSSSGVAWLVGGAALK